MDVLHTPRAIIDALGGTSAVAKLFGFDARVVSNWRSMERLPAHTFTTLTDALSTIDRSACRDAWSMSPPALASAAAQSERASAQ